jgi:hypothetical protein
MTKVIRTINLEGYTVDIFNKEIIIKEKAEAHSITLNEISKGFQFIKYLMTVNEKELMKFLDFYTLMVFAHIHLMPNMKYAEKYHNFTLEYISKELEKPLSPDDPKVLDELQKIHNIK